MDYPFTREVLEVCECDRSIRNRYLSKDTALCIFLLTLLISYKFTHLAYIRSALSYSTKASLRTDTSGILSMQFMIVNVTGKDETAGAGFVEFILMPLNEDD